MSTTAPGTISKVVRVSSSVARRSRSLLSLALGLALLSMLVSTPLSSALAATPKKVRGTGFVAQTKGGHVAVVLPATPAR